MRHRLVNVFVCVRLSWINAGRMSVLVMLVMGVAVRMFQPVVRVLVFVPLGHVQPDTDAHEDSHRNKKRPDRFAQQEQRHQRANEGRDGKVSAGACRADVPQREDETGEAQAVSKKTDDERACKYFEWR